MKAYEVYVNGRFTGITESNLSWASFYWAGQTRKNKEGKVYKLKEITIG